MLDTEVEHINIRTVIEVFKEELLNITLEIKDSLSSNLSKKKKEFLYEKLRKMHQNLKAAQEAEKLLIENPPFHSTVILEAIELAKKEESERRDNHRHRIFYEMFDSKAINANMPSHYRDLVSLIVNEIFAIRDALDPPIGKNYKKELRKIEKGALVESYAPAIQNYLDQGWNFEQIKKKLGIDSEQIKTALNGFKETKLRKEEDLTDTDNLTGFENFNDRTLCSDGNCIGIIDKNGHCKNCGKPYKKLK
jgi:Txe/YoeB family toxin of Txe-Axe toxin-antitoxin module